MGKFECIWFDTHWGSWSISTNHWWHGYALNYYEVYTYSTQFTGPVTLTTINFKIVRVGNLVTMSMTSPTTNGLPPSAAAFTSSTALPSRFYPAQSLLSPITVQNNGTQVYGLLQIGTSGVLTIGVGPQTGAVFTTGGSCGIYPFTVSWCV